jgi:kynurenine formamidase
MRYRSNRLSALVADTTTVHRSGGGGLKNAAKARSLVSIRVKHASACRDTPGEFIMQRPLQCLGFLAIPILAGCATTPGFTSGTWIDLSYDLSSETVYWPTAEPFKLETVAEGMTDKGYYYSAYTFSAAEHGGTHIDSPVHFAQGRKSVDQLPLEQLIGPAVKIDVSEKALADRDYLITIQDIEAWESKHGRIPDGSIVLFQTGYGRYWPDAEQYLGTALRGPEGVAALHFPGLDPLAAAWLVSNRTIKCVGIDTASIDRGQSEVYGAHVSLMMNNVPALENVANLEQLPSKGAHVFALPVKIKGGSGAPVRIAAYVLR